MGLRHLRSTRLFGALISSALVLAAVAPAVHGGAARADTAESIWPSTATPTRADSGDGGSVELGVKFTTAVNGTIIGVRFYKAAANGGTHVGHLWSSGGEMEAQTTFTGETNSGWQSATFAAPVAVTAGTTYIASYLAPVGHYSVDAAASAPADPASLATAARSANGDITALSSASSGGNGVYTYTSSPNGDFPSSTYASSNYWVDVLFAAGGTAAPASSIHGSGYTPTTASSGDVHPVSLGVQFQSQAGGFISGVRFYKGPGNTGTHVGSLWTARHTLLAQATFTGEAATGWQDTRFADPVPIVAGTTYIAAYFAPNGNYSLTANGLQSGIMNAPLLALPGGSTPGGNGVYSYGIAPQVPINNGNGADYAVDVDFSPTYNPPAAAQPTPRTGVTGDGSILVLTDPVNHFSDDYCGALLPTKGIACAATDMGNLTGAAVLAPYRTVIVADGAPPTADQVALVTTWVTGGGNLIAMRPAANLNGLLGIGGRADILPDAYLKIDNTVAPGSGIDGQTLQYHGVADEHPLAGARAVAALYADAATPTVYPAVTTWAVGAGTASAWMFDLARSVVYTRQGNPGLAGQAPASSDGLARVADRFALGYLDVTKAAVPQADLQVSLLANQIETAAFPVPIKWPFPVYEPNVNHPGGLLKAAFVLTGDDHGTGNSQTLNRFAGETAASPAGCSPAEWTCIRSTSYAYPGAFSDTRAGPYTDAGFEVAPHVSSNDGCAKNWSTQTQLDSLVTSAFTSWNASYPTISATHPPQTERLHCYGIWNDYASIAKVEAAHGIQADVDSACWPNSLLNTGQCLFTGAGLPQTLADADGTATGVTQFTTQATDENPVTVSQSAFNGLIANAIGPNGYYGYFTVLAHLDGLAISGQTEAAVLAVAAADDVPVISTAQAQSFWAARAATGISNPLFATATVTFTVTDPAPNLLLLQPAGYAGRTVSNITIGTMTVPFTTQTVNGVAYAVFRAATSGTYTVIYN